MDREDHGAGAAGAGRGAKARGYVRYNAQLGREICARMAAGEPVTAICAQPGMPSADTVYGWAREMADAEFGREYQRAKALATRDGLGGNTTYT